ncbi:MAG: CBS domain-containing protein [candidate division Zixibacteria bacterium]|jgi:CBS domain-containing protein/mannitol/fructose-specific phosphotransferase system IIA component (Ntr-type)|nr:CBS domain-containing protein [candidate division Zixibacteria bacterium]
MKLSRLLEPELIKVNLQATAKSDAIIELLDLVIAKYPDLEREEILNSIFEREEVENTSYGRGFSFPHARTGNVDRMYVAMGISKQGLGDDTMDGEPLRIICLMLTPRNISKFYLQTLSALATFARQPENRTSIFQAETAEDVVNLIAASGIELKKELTVREIMTEEPFFVTPDTTLKEVANLLFKHRISGLPVVDSNENVVGVITNRDLIRAAMPDYKSLISNLALTYEAAPFENLLRQEDRITVKELMSTDVYSVEEDASVVEVAAVMLFKDIRRVPVVRDNKLVGLVVISDIVSKIIRG